MAMDISEQGSTPKPSRGTRPERAQGWPYRAKGLAEEILDMFEEIAESSMQTTKQANGIDATILSSIEKIQAGGTAEGIAELRTVLGMTTAQRRGESNVLLSVAGASKRLSWSLHGKYDKRDSGE